MFAAPTFQDWTTTDVWPITSLARCISDMRKSERRTHNCKRIYKADNHQSETNRILHRLGEDMLMMGTVVEAMEEAEVVATGDKVGVGEDLEVGAVVEVDMVVAGGEILQVISESFHFLVGV